MIVDIDEAALDREFDAKLALLPADGTTGLEGEVLTANDAEWQRILRKFGVAEKLHHALAPSWEIDQEDKDAATTATGEILNTFWPGGIGNIDHWGPWAKLAFVGICIAAANFDDTTMTFKPRRPQPDPEPKEQPEDPHVQE